MTRGEVCQAIRSSGGGDLELVAAVGLETDGSLSVVAADRCRTASAMPATTAVPIWPSGAPWPRNTDREEPDVAGHDDLKDVANESDWFATITIPTPSNLDARARFQLEWRNARRQHSDTWDDEVEQLDEPV